MNEIDDKSALRSRYRALRDAIPVEDRDKRSEVIVRLLLTIQKLERAGSVFVYVSSRSEVTTLGLIGSLLGQGKTVAVPRVMSERGEMAAVVIGSLSDLAPGRFGILEPTTRDVLDSTPDLAVVPGLAFTRGGSRLGQGGGYYDRYLGQHPMAYKVGVCFNEQVAGRLPTDAHDVGMDEVISG